MQAVEVYSRQYYVSHVREKVYSIIKSKSLKKKEVLQVIKDCTREEFEASPADVKEKILKEVAEQEKHRLGNAEPVEFTPRDYSE